VRYLPNRYAEISQTTLTNNTFNIHIGDNQLILPTLPDNSVDSIVTDPPYELGFMGKRWDATGIAYNVEMWRECLRVLKPGGHLLAFSGSRTYHRMAVAIEDAGFQIRDQIMWVYGSGFPKSLNIGKAIDKAAGAEREVVGEGRYSTRRPRETVSAQITYSDGIGTYNSSLVTAPATAEAEVWDGWGTALKPAHEPIVLARKPLVGTVANNVLTHGVGGINIDGCRVGYSDDYDKKHQEDIRKGTGTFFGGNGVAVSPQIDMQGRFPANFIHDGSEEILELFPDTKNVSKGIRGRGSDIYAGGKGFANTLAEVGQEVGYGDSGSAARFFYCAKASKKDRNEGLDRFADKEVHRYGAGIGEGLTPNAPANDKNHHPTVKPTDLMRYLCRLITPPNGVVLDPFTGSGSTGKAALLEGFNFIGIEQSPEYAEIAQARIEHVATNE
jgi:site-specific DNA-methyltransferase (adenine-specific)